MSGGMVGVEAGFEEICVLSGSSPDISTFVEVGFNIGDFGNGSCEDVNVSLRPETSVDKASGEQLTIEKRKMRKVMRILTMLPILLLFASV
jgi:hypothetical protein